MEKSVGIEDTFISKWSDWDSTDIASMMFYDVVWTDYAKSFMKSPVEDFIMCHFCSENSLVELINKDYKKTISLKVKLTVVENA